VAGSFAKDDLALSGEALADLEGRNDDPVSLEHGAGDVIHAAWHDGVVPQTKEYDATASKKLQPWPECPTQLTLADPALWHALADATASASTEQNSRYVLSSLQLRGGKGEIAATDGHQLLIQSGCAFPWTEDVLVPATQLFACKELGGEEPLLIGKTDSHVVLRSGAWTIFLLIDKTGRFPKVEDAIPSLTGKFTRWQVDPIDAAFLADTLPRLPGAKDVDAPVTVDLNGQVLIRARGSDQANTTELVLARSTADKPVRFVVNRHFLLRALALGFPELDIINPDSALQCSDQHRRFVFMPIQKGAAVPASNKATRISSILKTQPVPDSHEASERSDAEMKNAPTSATNGTSGGTQREDAPPTNGEAHGGYSALIAEAEAVKNDLRSIFARVNQLIITIKRHRKQAQGVQAMLTNLRQLERIGG
jgi:hypothetical protein